MKIPTPWIKSYLGRTISDGRLIEALAQAGIEIEDYQPAKDLDKRVVVALVKKVAQHPNADKLRVAKVSTGEQNFEVVCGAPNLAEGQKVAFAQIGARLPDGEEIREAKLRGETSRGMICSAHELGLGHDHTGILVLPEDVEVGQPVRALFPATPVVDVKTPFNRYDLLSVTGLAREAAAFSGTSLKIPHSNELTVTGEPLGLVADERMVPRFMTAELNLGKLAPLGHQAWLEAAGTRAISPVVDVTNFVMWELGQPLHAYDADKLQGKLGVRFAKTGEKLVTLDGIERKLTKDDLVITDNSGAIGLAGVMGGQATQVSASTKRIILEAATFDAATIRKAAKRHGLRSEASARFERGLPVQLAPVALARAAQLLEEVAGAKLGAVTDDLRVWPWTQRIGLRHSRLERFTGTKISFNEAINSLNKLGIQAEKFDVVAEAKKHLGKPYKFGAKFRTDAAEAFDCSYLTDYLYSLIGQPIGHTAHQQFKSGQPVKTKDLLVGDLVFRGGPFEKRDEKEREGVSHVALYAGRGQIIHAIDIERGADQSWQARQRQEVVLEPMQSVTDDAQYLGARRFVEDVNDWISVREVPYWRPDLKTEEDLIEEIVRVIGYDRVPATLPEWRPKTLEFDWHTPGLWRLKEALSALGLFEVMTYSFVSQEQVAQMGHEPASHLKLQNPLSQEQAYLRRTPLPSLLTAAARNDRYGKTFGMYELTRVFEPGTSHKVLPAEPFRLSVLVKAGQPYAQIKGVLDAVGKMRAVDLRVEPSSQDKNFLRGRGGVVKLGNRNIGVIGQLAPGLGMRHKISGELGYLELDADILLGAAREFGVHSAAKFPPVLRDLNLKLTADRTWIQVRDVIIATGLADGQFVNDYYGPEVGEGKKNLAVRLTMADPDKTLTDQEAEQRVREILAALKKHLGAELAN